MVKSHLMMPPLVGAVFNPPEIWQMVDEMLVAGEKWLPQYRGKPFPPPKNVFPKGI